MSGMGSVKVNGSEVNMESNVQTNGCLSHFDLLPLLLSEAVADDIRSPV